MRTGLVFDAIYYRSSTSHRLRRHPSRLPLPRRFRYTRHRRTRTQMPRPRIHHQCILHLNHLSCKCPLDKVLILPTSPCTRPRRTHPQPLHRPHIRPRCTRPHRRPTTQWHRFPCTHSCTYKPPSQKVFLSRLLRIRGTHHPPLL